MVSSMPAFRKANPDGNCRASLQGIDGSPTYKSRCHSPCWMGKTRALVRSSALRQIRFFHCNEASGSMPGTEAGLWHTYKSLGTGANGIGTFREIAGVQAHRPCYRADFSAGSSSHLVSKVLLLQKTLSLPDSDLPSAVSATSTRCDHIGIPASN